MNSTQYPSLSLEDIRNKLVEFQNWSGGFLPNETIWEWECDGDEDVPQVSIFLGYWVTDDGDKGDEMRQLFEDVHDDEVKDPEILKMLSEIYIKP